MGFKSKKDIEKYGIEKFVKKCKERTLKFAKVQTEQSKRLGYFMDWENSYYTMSDENNYMIWTFLKKCFENGWLYKGRDSVPWCPRCGTAISQHEILTEEYQELTHDSIYLKLPITGNWKLETGNSYFLVWTTTPWTIPGNVALAVNPDFKYGVYQKDGENLILLKDLKVKILGKDWQEIKVFKGKELKGWEYKGPFDDLPRLKNVSHKVVLDKDLVTAEEGTGIVHIAPGAGQEDFHLAKKEKLDVVEVIDEEANYLDGFGKFSGQNAKDRPEIIIDYLREKDKGTFLFKVEKYTHRYPVCWRCKTELVWRLVEEWYICMNELRPKMMMVTRKINWLPPWGKERELDWLKNMEDWLISKKRYWGLALPIWECQGGHFEVIGSQEELKERAVEGWDKFVGHSPHRPWVDEIKIKCPKCGKLASRIKDVGNPWFDAGIVPFSTLKYRTDKKFWAEWFPADFITESLPGQFKNLFYSLIAMSTVLENTNSFKTVLGHGSVFGEDGLPIHKSLGNAIEFNQGASKMGVDVMRWMFLAHNPAENLLFGYKAADEIRRRFHLILWNVYNFFVSYANVNKFRVKEQESRRIKKSILDRWVLSELNLLIKEVTQDLENFEASKAALAMEKFVLDLSQWYVRRSRDRIGPGFYQTLYEILVIFSKILAPFNPFLAEEIFKNLTDKESVHLEDWPKVDNQLIDKDLINKMSIVRELVEQAHAIRKKHSLRLRQPLKAIWIIGEVEREKAIIQPYENLIKEEINVKKVLYGEYAKVVNNLIKKESTHTSGWINFYLDLELTPELKAEGEARDLVRQIQDLRKMAGCQLNQLIKVAGPNWQKDKKLQDFIKKETLATELLHGEKLEIA